MAGDFDNDGHVDLAFLYGATWDSLAWLRGKGDGTFGAPVPLAIPPKAWPLILADLNGDGRVDLVTAHHSGVVSVLLADGHGGFSGARQTAPIPPDDFGEADPKWLGAGDLNGDGALDVLVAGAGSDAMLGDGRGGLSPIPLHAAMPAVTYFDRVWTQFALGDFDEDRILDVYALGPNVLGEILHGLGNGYFSKVSQGDSYTSVITADLNRDRHLDLVFFSPFGEVYAALGRGDATFGDAIRACPHPLPGNRFDGPYPLLGSAITYPVADVDRDGNLDVLVMTDQALVVARGVGDGTFRPADVFPVPSKQPFYYGVAVTDVNDDCRPDVVISDLNGGTLQVLLNTTP